MRAELDPGLMVRGLKIRVRSLDFIGDKLEGYWNV